MHLASFTHNALALHFPSYTCQLVDSQSSEVYRQLVKMLPPMKTGADDVPRSLMIFQGHVSCDWLNKLDRHVILIGQKTICDYPVLIMTKVVLARLLYNGQERWYGQLYIILDLLNFALLWKQQQLQHL